MLFYFKFPNNTVIRFFGLDFIFLFNPLFVCLFDRSIFSISPAFLSFFCLFDIISDFDFLPSGERGLIGLTFSILLKVSQVLVAALI